MSVKRQMNDILLYVSQLVLPQTNASFIKYPEWFEKSTWGHYCPKGWVSNCDRKYLAFAFSTSSLIECNIVYNTAIESLFIWHLLYFGRILKPCGSQMRLKGNLCVFLFQINFLSLCHFCNFSKINYGIHRRTNSYITTLFECIKYT